MHTIAGKLTESIILGYNIAYQAGKANKPERYGYMKKTYYVTTPIYYSSGAPHIGHSCTTLAADLRSRLANP